MKKDVAADVTILQSHLKKCFTGFVVLSVDSAWHIINVSPLNYYRHQGNHLKKSSERPSMCLITTKIQIELDFFLFQLQIFADSHNTCNIIVYFLSLIDITKHTGLINTRNRTCVLKPGLMGLKQHHLLIKTSLFEQLLTALTLCVVH